MYGPDPATSRDFGRIVTREHAARLVRLVEESVAQGARVVVGGEADVAARYVAPTVLADVTPSSPVMAEEIFGPVLPIVPVTDLDAAVRQVRAGEKPLALYAFTADEEARRRLVEETSSGAVGLDVPLIHASMPTLPFGGVGGSGFGAYHGEASVRTFSHAKPVVHKRLSPDACGGAERWRRLRARCAWRALAGGAERRGAAHERLPAHERPAAPAGLPGPAVGVERAGEPAAGPLDVDVQRVEGRAARGERLAHDVLRGGEHVDGGPLGELVRGAARVEPGTPEGLVGVDVADAGDERLVQQGPLDLGTPRAQPPGEAGAVERRVERVAGDVRGRLGQRRQRGAVAAGAA